ncbi:excalibur calcium-binding domain-containing protein [Corynebacterium matruchotii]
MRKTLVTFTIAISLGLSGTVANAQEAAPADPATQVADSTVSAEAEATPAPADATTTNNTETTAEAATAAESEAAEPANAEADQPEITQTADSTNQSQKTSSNPTLRTVGIIAGVVSLLGLIGGGIFWAIQQNLINIPGLPGLPNPNPAPAPAPQGKYYPNCKAVWDELGRPIRNGEPGYDRNLDHDGDGVGCEQRPR